MSTLPAMTHARHVERLREMVNQERDDRRNLADELQEVSYDRYQAVEALRRFIDEAKAAKRAIFDVTLYQPMDPANPYDWGSYVCIECRCPKGTEEEPAGHKPHCSLARLAEHYHLLGRAIGRAEAAIDGKPTPDWAKELR